MFTCQLEAKKLKKGDIAPLFSLPDQDNKMVDLAHYKGNNIALYFYPMDGTYGCTKQACSIRDGFADLKDAGIVVLGISYDSPRSHKKFQQKHHLPFTLLSDVDQKVAELYGATRWAIFSWFGTKRITVLINKKGVVVDILKDIDLAHHAGQIIKAFEKV